ncbi:MAG: helix-turn-helix domain-containing protein [Chthoniobacterales bacterium]|nr:helix-turn-helix domain-containing protein [Chthoniobacterales bacterium]
MPRKPVGKETGKKNAFGPKLKALRRAKGLTQAQVAAKLGVQGWELSETNLGHIEAQRRTLTDLELLALLKVLRARLLILES